MPQPPQSEQIPADLVIDELLREIARLNGELATARVLIRQRDQQLAQRDPDRTEA